MTSLEHVMVLTSVKLASSNNSAGPIARLGTAFKALNFCKNGSSWLGGRGDGDAKKSILDIEGDSDVNSDTCDLSLSEARWIAGIIVSLSITANCEVEKIWPWRSRIERKASTLPRWIKQPTPLAAVLAVDVMPLARPSNIGRHKTRPRLSDSDNPIYVYPML